MSHILKTTRTIIEEFPIQFGDCVEGVRRVYDNDEYYFSFDDYRFRGKIVEAYWRNETSVLVACEIQKKTVPVKLKEITRLNGLKVLHIHQEEVK